jgi:uncharacterized protein (TIGR02611 family)
MRRERHLARGRLYRLVLAVAGFTVLLLGVALLVLPGPGLVVIVVGLTILALEFAWAERMLERAIDRMERARQATKEATLWQKIFGGLAVAAGFGAVIAAAAYWAVPLLPF